MSEQTKSETTFRIDVPQADLDDLHERLGRVRWPGVVDEDNQTHGISVSMMRRLVERWRDGYDWRAHETTLNHLAHGIRRVRGLDIHHIVERAQEASGVPVVLLHGWPDSFYRYHLLMPRLTAAGHDVVVPSLPGYLFSQQPTDSISIAEVAEVVHELVTGLGYGRYAAHGGDWGSAVAEQLATAHPEAVVALHLTDVPYHHQFEVDHGEVTDPERAFLEGMQSWGDNASYFSVQANDPTTLSYGLSDSPVGLAAWLVDKYRSWTDRDPDLDQVLTQVSLYWHTNSIRSSMRLYSEGMGSWEESANWSDEGAAESAQADGAWPDAGGWGASGPLPVPTAFALFPHDIGVPPREFAERFFTVERFTLMPRGGHFGALEEPDLLADDLVAFLATEPWARNTVDAGA